MNYKSFDGFIATIMVLGVAATATAVVKQNTVDFFELTPAVEALNTPFRHTNPEPVATSTEVAKIKPSTHTVHIGQSFTYDDTKVTFVDIATDSRCPIDVVCIWAGEFVGRFTLEKKNNVELLMIKNTATTTSSSYDIHVEKITPEPIANKNIAQKDYSVTLSVGPKK